MSCSWYVNELWFVVGASPPFKLHLAMIATRLNYTQFPGERHRMYSERDKSRSRPVLHRVCCPGFA